MIEYNLNCQSEVRIFEVKNGKYPKFTLTKELYEVEFDPRRPLHEGVDLNYRIRQFAPFGHKKYRSGIPKTVDLLNFKSQIFKIAAEDCKCSYNLRLKLIALWHKKTAHGCGRLGFICFQRVRRRKAIL